MNEPIPDFKQFSREKLLECRTIIDRILYEPPELRRYLKYRLPFRELVAMALNLFWEREPQATEWRGSKNALMHMIYTHIDTNKIASQMNMSQANRFLAEMEAEGLCRVESDCRYPVWLFPKPITQEKL